MRDEIDQATKLGCDQIVCAGDIVDGGLFPQETIDLLIKHKIPTIRGNHDRWAIGRGRPDSHEEVEVAPRDATGWDLSPHAIRYLAQLPTTLDATFDGVGIGVRHGSPRGDMDGVLPEQISARQAQAWFEEIGANVMIVGHTHIAFAICTSDGGLIANPGALLRVHANDQEADGQLFDPDREVFVPAPARGGGTFAVLDTMTMRFTVHRANDGAEIDIIRRSLETQ